jgi:putative redox protein
MIRLTWSKSLQFEAEDDHHHHIIVDTNRESGGLDQGFRPMDLLLVALTGCMAMDIVAILQKKGGKIESFAMEAAGTRAEKHPRKYNKIKVKIMCKGVYRREDLLRSFELSRDKYCSVFATLSSNPEFEFVVE